MESHSASIVLDSTATWRHVQRRAYKVHSETGVTDAELPHSSMGTGLIGALVVVVVA